FPPRYSRPRLFSFVRPRRGSIGFEWRDWQLKPTRLLPPYDEERLRLRMISKRNLRDDEEREGETNTKRYPALSKELVIALSAAQEKTLRQAELAERSQGDQDVIAATEELPQGCFDPPGK